MRIERDIEELKVFYGKMDTYCDSMREACKTMLNHIDDAASINHDEKSLEVVNKLSDVIQDILSEIPSAENVSVRVRTMYEDGREYEDLVIGRSR